MELVQVLDRQPKGGRPGPVGFCRIGLEVEEKEVALAVGTEDERRVVGVLRAAGDVVAKTKGLSVEADRFIGVVNGDLDLNGSAACYCGHGDSLLYVALGVCDASSHVAGLACEPVPVATQDASCLLAGRIVEDASHIFDGQIDPAQRLDEPGGLHLAAPVAAIPGRRVDLSRREQANVVVVPQGVNRKPADPGEAPDGHQLVPLHSVSLLPRVARVSRKRRLLVGPPASKCVRIRRWRRRRATCGLGSIPPGCPSEPPWPP